MSYAIGDRYWIPDDEHAWLMGTIKEFKNSVLEFNTDKGIKKFRVNDLKHKLEPCGSHVEDQVENLVDLDELSEGAILHHVRNRFLKKVIYTHVGSILVAVNPFENLPIYGERDIRRANETTQSYPHVFVTASTAYQQLKNNQKNQSVLISGESGAGKTETTKKVLQFLANVAPDTKKKHDNEPGMETKILQSNPLLEALGNAKTLRNNNSSRFGKWMKVGFNKHFLIQGCEIVNYLLEKSRVVSQSLNERNYHIFYQLIAGADAAMKQKLYLKAPNEYHYLNQSNCYKIDNVDDQQEFQDVVEAMHTLQFSDETIQSMFQIISGILLLGNIAYDPDTSSDNSRVSTSSMELLQHCCELLGINIDLFKFSLTEKRVQMGRGSVVSMKLTVSQAMDSRDTLAKFLYSNMFDWTIQQVNKTLHDEKEGASSYTIGILDIFGFEVFDLNTFEQLCINYANEKLQYHFNEVIFSEEKLMYEAEGVSLESIQFEDNGDCVNLIEGKPYGLLALLDEECSLGTNATDFTYIAKLEKTFGTGKQNANKYFVKNKVKPEYFSVLHFAGAVEYNVTNFLDKNRDTLSITKREVMLQSSIKLVHDMFVEKNEHGEEAAAAPSRRGGGGGKQKASNSNKTTLGGSFRNQLIELVNNLKTTEPHFIRCVKPNHQKVGHLFDGVLALRQLRYAGLFEAIRIRKSGYAYRSSHQTFFNLYHILVDHLKTKVHRNELTLRDACVKILESVSKSGGLTKAMWVVGKTSKVFLKNNSDRMILEKERASRITQYIIRLQRFIRFYLKKLILFKEIYEMKKMKLQQKEKTQKETKCIVLIQKSWRRKQVYLIMKSMKHFIELRKVIQTRDIAKIKDLLSKIDVDILKQFPSNNNNNKSSTAGSVMSGTNMSTPMKTGGSNLASLWASPSTPTGPLSLNDLSLSPMKETKETSKHTKETQDTKPATYDQRTEILSMFQHEIKVGRVMLKLMELQETVVADTLSAIEQQNIHQINACILQAERLEMANHPIVLQAKEMIFHLYHKRKVMKELLYFIQHENEFNENIIVMIEEAKQLQIDPEFLQKIQLIYDNAGPRLKCRQRLRHAIELVNQYEIEQTVMEILQIRQIHKDFGEAELKAAKNMLYMISCDRLLYPELYRDYEIAEALVEINEDHGEGNDNNNPEEDNGEQTERNTTIKRKEPLMLWGRPMVRDPTGGKLTPELILLCEQITQCNIPSALKSLKQQLQEQLGPSIDRIYQNIRYFKWSKICCTWKYPEVTHKSTPSVSASQTSGVSSAKKKTGPLAVYDNDQDNTNSLQYNEEFFGLRCSEARCNPYVIRTLHQDFDTYNNKTNSAMMNAALSLLSTNQSMKETLINLDLQNNIDLSIELPNGKTYTKTAIRNPTKLQQLDQQKNDINQHHNTYNNRNNSSQMTSTNSPKKSQETSFYATNTSFSSSMKRKTSLPNVPIKTIDYMDENAIEKQLQLSRAKKAAELKRVEQDHHRLKRNVKQGWK